MQVKCFFFNMVTLKVEESCVKSEIRLTIINETKEEV